jgi:hypothetical protein
MRRDGDSDFWLAVRLAAAVFALVLAAWVIQAWQEARAFERVTGRHVSTLDAMFVDLRVQEAPLPDPLKHRATSPPRAEPVGATPDKDNPP